MLSVAFLNCPAAAHCDETKSGASAPKPWRFELVAECGLGWPQRSGDAAQEFIVDVKSTGAALLDFDRDGWLDVFLTSGSTVARQKQGKPGFGCRLYRNLEGVRFEEVPLSVAPFGWACGAAAADVNGDGWVDLLVTCYGPDRLLLNDQGTLRDAKPGHGLDQDTGWSTSAAFADLDGDGDLDLYVARYLDFNFENPPRHGQPGWSCQYRGTPVACGPRGLPARADGVFRNDGTGRFQEVSAEWGFAGTTPQFGLGVLIADLVGDHRPDIFVANDATPNLLFQNHGSRFEEIGFLAGVAYNEDGEEQAGMGVDAADLDGNGHLDLIVTNFEQELNNVYLNQGNGFFFDQPDAVGIGAVGRDSLSWGVAFRDFDNDGTIDLYVANGHVYRQADDDPKSPGYAQRDHVFRGSRKPEGLRFVEVGTELGVTKRGVSRGSVFGDLDNDGDTDVIVCNLNEVPTVWRNHAPAANRSLTVRLQQPGANPHALGARIDLRVGKLKQLQEVRRHASFQGSNDPRVHFGLGTTREPAQLRVRWPDGQEEEFNVGPAERFVTLSRKNTGSPTTKPRDATPPKEN